jgi:hypothetical protein
MRLADGQDVGRGTQHPGGKGDGIDAKVKQGASGEIGAQDVVVGAEILTNASQYGADLAEDAGFQDLADEVESEEEEGLQCLRAEQVPLGGESGDLDGLCGVQADRLLDKRVPASLRREPGR